MKSFNRNQLEGLDDQAYEEMRAIEEENAIAKSEERFEGRFRTDRPWVFRNAANRKWAGYLSYVFNFISVLAAFYGGKVLMEVINIPYLPWITAAAALILMEKLKRHFSDSFWDYFWAHHNRINWGAAVANFSLLLISVAISVGGMYFMVMDNSGETKLMGESGDPEAIAMQDRLKVIDQELIDLRADKSNYNSEGQFYHIHVPKENALKEERATIAKTLSEKHGIYNIQNQDILSISKLRRGFKAYTSVIITLLAEIFFELCMAFCSYFDWRHYLARKALRKRKTSSTPSGQSIQNGKKTLAPA